MIHSLSGHKKERQQKRKRTIQNAKVKGIEHTNHVGKHLPKQITGDDCRCSIFHCFEKITETERRQIMENFNDMASKNEQDSRLSGLIALHIIARRRPRVSNHENSKDHAASYTYKVRLAGKNLPVCHKAFISIHGISTHRVNRLQQSLVMTTQSPKGQRGRHENRPTKIPNAVMHLIECHINLFQARKSHYSLRDNPRRRYLPEHFTVAKMHKLFDQEYHINVPYKAYWLIFKTFSIHFSFPRFHGTKNESSRHTGRKSSTRNRENLTSKESHCLPCCKKEIHFKSKTRKHKFFVIRLHAELTLSHITSNVFYSQQLWYNIFGVHNLGDDLATMYHYCEHEGKKGTNEVTSILLDYINHNREDKIKELVLTSDGSPCQNKNRTMMHIIILPSRTYLPNDQDFSLIGHTKKITTSAELPVDWDSVICNARKYPTPFTLCIMRYDNFKDMKAATDPFFLKTPKPPLQLTEARVVKGESTLRFKNTYSGPWATHIIPALYQCNPRIKPAKANDLAKLMAYLECPANRVFYEDVICGGPVNGSSNNTDSDFEVDDDDNSSGCGS
ncbi:hypothetical protein PR048_004537 [Dryococelus australis]|uniref:Uncharacterized protein n=1 Tax=Dryococelus australis TaxID=614101 RepID=A0ABQ9I5P8_9NEOP|nr:hypothetical protein PR048_004537 [Dryococelus australis]